MKVFRIVAVMVMVAFACMANAAVAFHTERLAHIAKAVGITPDETQLKPDMDNDTSYFYHGRKLRVRTNEFGDISNIGYKLFGKELLENYKYPQVLDFIERYSLELDLSLDGRSASNRMALDKVTCTKGNFAFLKDITPATSFSDNVMERRFYILRWQTRRGVLELSFPADYQLISGADAVELENMFERDVQRIVPIPKDAILTDWNNMPVSRSGDQIIVNSGEYLSKVIRSDLYLQEKKGIRALVADAVRQPLHTVTNILLTGIYDRELPMSVTLDRYGYKTSDLKVPLQKFIALCRMEGCNMYVGVKSRSENEISAVVFAYNGDMAYNHVLSVKFPMNILKGGDDVITARLYAYIPLQNVTEKFFTQDL